jgi:hypothetical protein
MVSLAKLLRDMQGIEKKYKNIELEKISVVYCGFFFNLIF